MAVTSFDPRNPQIQSQGRVPQIVYGSDEANSQSFKAGQFVYFNAGAVTVSADGDVPMAGIALKDATNVTSDNIEIPVQMLTPEDEVLIQVTTGGTLEASDTTCTSGEAYDLETVTDGTANLHYIDSSDTTNPKFVYIGPVLNGAGDSTYWGRFRPYAVEAQMIEGNV